MSDTSPRNVSLAIGGRNHVISVGADEEPHLRMLAKMIDERASTLVLGPGQTETRMFLVTALMLADELHTLQNAPATAAAPAPTPVAAKQASTKVSPDADIAPQVLARVAELADRVEKLAARLEHSGETP